MIYYSLRNSWIHKFNPLVKLIPFLLTVVLVFLKTDFFVQLIIICILLLLYLLARLPLAILKKLLVTYFFMFILLMAINWFTEKSPLHIEYATFAQAKVVGYGPGLQENEVITAGFVGDSGIVIGNNPTNPNIAHVFTKINNKKEIDIVKEWIKTNNVNLAGFGQSLVRTSIIGTNSSGAIQFYAYVVPWYGMSNYSWLSSIYISNKLLIVIVASTIFTATTSTIALSYAFEDILKPLGVLRLPVKELAMILSITIRFIPSLIAESLRIMQAQASRGIDFKNGNIFAKIQALSSLIIPLFTTAFLKADDLANAMSARSYNPRYARTRFRTFSLHSYDLIGFIILVSTIAGFYYLTSVQFVFGYFGVNNALVVLGR